jgi:CBS domain-containing membrane protein
MTTSAWLAFDESHDEFANVFRLACDRCMAQYLDRQLSLTNDSLDRIYTMTQKLPDDLNGVLVGDGTSEMELTDDDILDAMQHIPGYLDITTEDFRSIYHLAHRHALERLFTGVTAGRLMRSAITPLQPDTTLDIAARTLADSGYKALPVVDDSGHVIGMLTETDFLNRLKAGSFLELLLKLLEDSFEFTHRCHETKVSAAMTQPAVTVNPEAGFIEILEAFHLHGGRSMPVVGDDGRLHGLLLRKDFIAAYKLQESV